LDFPIGHSNLKRSDLLGFPKTFLDLILKLKATGFDLPSFDFATFDVTIEEEMDST
jgi:hypothetical protein